MSDEHAHTLSTSGREHNLGIDEIGGMKVPVEDSNLYINLYSNRLLRAVNDIAAELLSAL